MLYLVSVGQGSSEYYGWEDYEGLQRICKYMDSLPDEETEEYDGDSPYAHFMTGLHCDSFADTSIDIMRGIWEDYCDTCEEEERQPDWEEYMDICCAAEAPELAELQLCRTWQRVTNIHIDDDNDIEQFIREGNSCTMKDVLGM
jgi:hypothetical protein